MEVDRLADLVAEALEDGDRFDGEADVRGVGKLMAHAARVSAGRSRREHRLALDEHDIGHAAAGEVAGDAGTHASAADDHHLGATLHRTGEGVQGSRFRVQGSFRF